MRCLLPTNATRNKKKRNTTATLSLETKNDPETIKDSKRKLLEVKEIEILSREKDILSPYFFRLEQISSFSLTHEVLLLLEITLKNESTGELSPCYTEFYSYDE